MCQVPCAHLLQVPFHSFQKHGAQVGMCIIIDLVMCIAFVFRNKFFQHVQYIIPKAAFVLVDHYAACTVARGDNANTIFYPCSFTIARTRSVMSMISVLVVVWISMFLIISLI